MEGSLGGAEPDALLGRVKPCIVTTKGRLAQKELRSCSHWTPGSGRASGNSPGSQVTQDDAHTGTQCHWFEHSPG